MSNTLAQVDDLVSRVCGTPEVLTEPDLDLIEAGILDSLGTIELLVGIGDITGSPISPTEVDRDEFNTVTKIRAFAHALS